MSTEKHITFIYKHLNQKFYIPAAIYHYFHFSVLFWLKKMFGSIFHQWHKHIISTIETLVLLIPFQKITPTNLHKFYAHTNRRTLQQTTVLPTWQHRVINHWLLSSLYSLFYFGHFGITIHHTHILYLNNFFLHLSYLNIFLLYITLFGHVCFA